MPRLPRSKRGLVLFTSALATLTLLHSTYADTSYFSFQGSFSAGAGESQDFLYTLSAASNPVTLKTLAFSGGFNVANQAIPSGGIDSILSLYNSTGTTLLASDDDASPAVPAGTRDSLLSPTGTNAGGTNNSLLPAQSPGSYDLRLTNFNSAGGNWAADIINAATSANTVLTSSTGSLSSITSLTFGVSSGTSNATLNLSSSTLTLASTGSLTANTGAILNLTSSGTLNANGNITVNAGQFLQSGGTFNWAAGKTMAINSGGHVDITTGFAYALPSSSSVNITGAGSRLKVANASASTLLVNSGSQITNAGGSLLPDLLFIGTSGNGSVSITSGGVLNALGSAAGFTNVIGSSGNTGSLTVSTSSSASFVNPLLVGDAGGPFTSGSISIQSASYLYTNSVSLASNTSSILANGTITVTGLGSQWQQAGTSTLTIGGPAGGAGTVNILNLSSYINASSGIITVNKTGTLNVSSNASFANGTGLTVNGGSLFVDPSASNFVAGATFLIQNGGTANIALPLSSQPYSSSNSFVTVDGAGSSLTLSAPSENSFGYNGLSTNVTFSHGATGTIAGMIGLVDLSTFDSSTASFNILSGAKVSGTSAAGIPLMIGTGGFISQSASFNVDGIGSSFNQNASSAATINIGNGVSLGAINVSNSATFTTGTGATNINSGGGINVSSFAQYNANGPIEVYPGGSLIVNSATLTSTAGLDNEGLVKVNSGSHLSTNFLTFAYSASATLLVDGNGSSFVCPFDTYLGLNGNTATATFSNNSSGTFSGGLELAQSIFASTANVTVETGASLSVATLSMAASSSAGSGTSATLTITDPYSSVTLLPGFALTLGDFYGDVATLNVQNNASLTVGTGGSTTINTGSTLNINGGTANLQTLTDNGTINFSTGSLSYIGDLTVGIGGILGPSLTLSPNQFLSLTGTTTVSQFHTLTLNGGTLNTGSLVNNGTFSFLSGTLGITGPAGLTFSSAGPLGSNYTVTPSQTISVPNSYATVNPGSSLTLAGTLTSPLGLTNYGEVKMTGGSLAGIGTFTNYKLIDGTGTISQTLSNSTGGEVRALNSDHLSFTSTTASSNTSKINLINGGTVEFGGVLTNFASGAISGQGTLITVALINAGKISFATSSSDVYGSVNNLGHILISNGAAVNFWDPFNNGAGANVDVAANSSVFFNSPVTGTGTFTGTGIKYFSDGSSTTSALEPGGITVVAEPASLTTPDFIESSLQVSGHANTPPSTAGGHTSKVNSLFIDTTGQLDLADNKLILDYTGSSPINQLRLYLLSGRNGGSWTGIGLVSSLAASNPNHSTAIAYAEASQLGVSSWGGQLVDSTALLTKYTYYGDLNMDGKVNADDYALFDRGLSKHLTGWLNGDVNYDNLVNSADALLIDTSYAQQSGPLSPTFLAERESQFGEAYVQSLLTSIPEPSLSSILYPLSSLLLLPRRRQPSPL